MRGGAMGIIAIWKHLTEQSRASSPCLEVAFRILLAGDPYIWCDQRGGVETHGKQVLYVRSTSLASAHSTNHTLGASALVLTP